MGESKASGMFGAGLRGVIAAPLEAVRRRASGQVEQHDSVNTIIESEIIPRLLMAHSATDTRTRSRPRLLRAISPDEAARFAELPLRLEAAPARRG